MERSWVEHGVYTLNESLVIVSFITAVAQRIAMPADTVISYWKPEVAVRLVTDFTRYPLHHGDNHTLSRAHEETDEYIIDMD